MPNLSNKVALVTGASRGMGRAIAERLARDGAAVAVNYSASREKAEAVVDGITRAGGRAIALQGDASLSAEIRRMFDEVEAALGRLDLLVCNAGTFLAKPIAEVEEDEFTRLFDLNVRGVFFALQEGAKRLNDAGRIVALSSNATLNARPGLAAYAASKAAVEQLVKGLAVELGSRQITVNAVAPGATDTDMLPPQARDMAARLTPLARLGRPDDIADVVAFLCSSDARWVTGQVIGANGGLV